MKNHFIRACVILTVAFLGLNSAYAGFLRFPILGYTPSNTRITAVMDHNIPPDNSLGSIKTYTGETGSVSNGCRAWVNGQAVACTSANTTAPRAYKRSGGAQWSVSAFNYTDFTENYNVYMWYDNHHGYDYQVGQWTPVVASATGTIIEINGTWGQMTIDHGNGYRTTYTHMYLLLPQMQTVQKGAQIGWVSNVSPTPVGVHLHFVVKRNISGVWKLVDPYGGSGQPVLWE